MCGLAGAQIWTIYGKTYSDLWQVLNIHEQIKHMVGDNNITTVCLVFGKIDYILLGTVLIHFCLILQEYDT